MRLFTVFLIMLLALTACAAPAGDLPATSPPANTPRASPTSIPAKTTAAALKDATANATFETSLLAVEWKGGSKGNLLFPLDPASETALSDYTPISLGQTFFHAFSPDRHTLAAVSFPNQYANDGSLLLIDLSTWKAQRFELDLDGWVSTMVFSPDGKRLAVAHGESTYKLTIIDVEQGVIMAQAQIDAYVTRMKFTATGDALMLYTSAISMTDGLSADPPQVLLLDPADLSPRWSAELKAVREGIFPMNEDVTPEDIHQPGQALYLSPAVTFAPDRDVLYVVHADSDHLTTVDFDGQMVETVEVRARVGWFEQLLSLSAGVAHAKIGDGSSKQAAVSPDGQFLYVIGAESRTSQDEYGNWDMEQTSLGLEIIQTSDGSRVERFETDATELSLSPDGRLLYLKHWEKDLPWTEIFDTSSLQFLSHRAKVHATPALLMNGEFLLVSTYSTSEFSHHMSVLHPEDLSALVNWTDHNYIFWLTTP